MKFSNFSQKLANEINAEHTEYDDNHSVFIVPLNDGRFQTVIARVMDHPKFQKKVLKITSKVCYITEAIDYESVLSGTAEFVHTRFIIEDGVLKAEAALFYDNVSDEIMKEMIMEVTSTADDWEFKITGKDNF